MSAIGPEGTGRLILACPGCAEKYILEASQVPRQGGTLFCRSCGAKVELPPRDILPLGSSAGSLSQEPMSSVSAGSGLAPTAVASSSSTDGVHEPGATLVECPRCGHAFASPASHAAPTRARSSEGPKTVLIVEDTEFFLALASEALGARYRTLPARTAAEGIGFLQQEVVDLVVLDLGLDEEKGGLKVLAEASRLKIPCLIFTAKSESELWGDAWEELKEHGATDLLIKGMNVEDQLQAKVGALLPIT